MRGGQQNKSGKNSNVIQNNKIVMENNAVKKIDGCGN